jgi:SAM-dependent methyltransferase
MAQTEVKKILAPGARATRGHGFLEPFLARRRYRMAQSLIPSDRRNGCIVDIGCGSSPLFLATSGFAEKIGLDKSFNAGIIESFASPNLKLIEHDIEKVVELPLESNSCDVVTMLAVIEHIEPHRLKPLLAEIYRILKPGGVYILTTPAPWTDGLLRIMARMKLVSPAEIDEHKDAYDRASIFAMLAVAGFREENLQGGYFELGLNVWAAGTKA